jgi:hypothetical protein
VYGADFTDLDAKAGLFVDLAACGIANVLVPLDVAAWDAPETRVTSAGAPAE